MTFYARRPGKLARQVVADGLVVAWTLAWAAVGVAVHATISGLARPARQIALTASDLQRQAVDLARQAAGVPVVGDGLRPPIDGMASSLGELAAQASGQVAGLERTAVIVALTIALVPVLTIVAVWLPARLRFASTARILLAIEAAPNGTDLLALRALVNSTADDLLAVDPDPLAAWRRGDTQAIDRLATLELERAGIRRPASRR